MNGATHAISLMVNLMSEGVATFLSKKVAKAVKLNVKDKDGRYLLLKLDLNGNSYCVANIYAPNIDSPEFFVQLFQDIKKLECDFSVICGDFNVVMNQELDRNKDAPAECHTQARQVIQNEMENECLMDLWQHLHPGKKSFTWCKTKPKLQWSRLDYFLCSEAMANKCVLCEIIPCVLTDHSCIELVLDTSVSKRGPGSWKFNNTYLKNEKFCKELSDVITGIKKIYGYMNPMQLWEVIKQEIGQYCRWFA